MSWKEGYEKYTAITGTPSMTITRNGISFNQAAINKLGKPPYVNLYIDKRRTRFAIEASYEDADGALFFYKPGTPTSKGVRWNNADLRATFEQLMGWDVELLGYKVIGNFRDEDVPALEFRLADAKPLVGRGTRRT